MSKLLSDLGVEQLSSGHFVVAPNVLPDVIDMAIQGGRRVVLLGRTSNDASGQVVFILDDIEQATTDAANRVLGDLPSSDPISEGIFFVSLGDVVSSAGRARAQGLAMRLLGFVLNDERKDIVRAQFFQQPPQINTFPQEFWMNRVGKLPDLSSALMEVMQRRS